MTKLFSLLAAVLLLCNCQLPKDPHQTLINIQRSHILKVGICPLNSEEHFSDLALLKKLSSMLKAELTQVGDVEDTLLRKLEKHDLDLVVCKIREDNPWGERVAFTSPVLNEFNQEKYVWAVGQGENAWLKYMDNFIRTL